MLQNLTSEYAQMYTIITIIAAALFTVLISTICQAFLYRKAGYVGWEALVPFYNTWCKMRLIGLPGWVASVIVVITPLTSILPKTVSNILSIPVLLLNLWIFLKYFECYGVKQNMIVFTFLLPVIGLPIIAFSHKYEYQGPQYERADKKFDIPLFIIASILAIVFWIFCCYIMCTAATRVIDAYENLEDKYNASAESDDSSVSYIEIAKDILPSLDPKTSYVTVEYNGNPIKLGFTDKHMSLPDDNGNHKDFCLDVFAYNEDNSDYYRLWIYDKAKALDYFGSAVSNSMNEVYDSFDNNTDKQTVNICDINFTVTEINDSSCKVVFGRSDDDNVEFIVYTSLSDNNAIDKLTTCLTVEPNSDDAIDESSETNTSTSYLPNEKNNYVTVEYNDSPIKLRVTDKCMAVYHNFDLSDTDTEFFLSAAFIDEDTSSDYNIEIWDKDKMLDYYGSRFEDHTSGFYAIFDNSESKDKQTVNIGGINFTVINCGYEKHIVFGRSDDGNVEFVVNKHDIPYDKIIDNLPTCLVAE